VQRGANRAANSNPPGLATTTRMAARPSNCLQRRSLHPSCSRTSFSIQIPMLGKPIRRGTKQRCRASSAGRSRNGAPVQRKHPKGQVIAPAPEITTQGQHGATFKEQLARRPPHPCARRARDDSRQGAVVAKSEQDARTREVRQRRTVGLCEDVSHSVPKRCIEAPVSFLPC
jgi:hypothetical protein